MRSDLLGLAGLGGGHACIVEGNADLAQNRSLIHAGSREGRIILHGAADAGLHGHGRKQPAFRHCDRRLGDIHIELRGKDGRVLLTRHVRRIRKSRRREPVHRRCGQQLRGRLAHHLAVGRLAHG